MFVVISQRMEFTRLWGRVLDRHDKTCHANTLAEARQLLLAHPVSLVVLDFSLIHSDAQLQLQSLYSQCGKARLVLGATDFEPQQELAAIAGGVVACCDSGLQARELGRIVDTVLQGGVWVSRAAIPLLVAKLQQAAVRTRNELEAAAPGDASFHGLTGRQREVAEMVAHGANNKQIANTLNITDRTVKAHLTAIFEKLGVTDRLHLALYINNHKGGS